MNTLEDPRRRLADELERHPHATVDVDRLVVAARTRGAAVRRRRRAGGVAGAVALLALGSAGVVTAWPEDPGRDAEVADPAPSPTDTDPARPSEAPPRPATARGAAAALDAAVRQQVPGTTSDHAGQSPANGSADYSAQLVLDDGQGPGEVGLNVQFGIDFVQTCENASSVTTTCASRRLPGGGRITTLEEVESGHVRRVVDLRRADGVRVVLSASNGFDLASNQFDVRRPDPALTAAQLATVAQLPVWQETLPARVLEAGERLRPFRDLGD